MIRDNAWLWLQVVVSLGSAGAFFFFALNKSWEMAGLASLIFVMSLALTILKSDVSDSF